MLNSVEHELFYNLWACSRFTAAISYDFNNVIKSLVQLKTEPGLGDRRSQHIMKIAISGRPFVNGRSLERLLRQNRGPGASPNSVQTVRINIRSDCLKSRNLMKRHCFLRVTELHGSSFAGETLAGTTE